MHYQQLRASTYRDSLKVLEADIQRASALASAIPKAKKGSQLRLRLVYNGLAPFVLYFLRWMDCSCTFFSPRFLNPFYILIYKVYIDGRQKISRSGRKASIKDFYDIILPSLQRLHCDLVERDASDKTNLSAPKNNRKKRPQGDSRLLSLETERDDECGICLEPCSKIVLPNCFHTMCINCYRDWNTRSESCPFCRGSLRRVESRDLWVLTCEDDVIDPEIISSEDLQRFYLYIRNLPKDCPDVLFLTYYEYLI